MDRSRNNCMLSPLWVTVVMHDSGQCQQLGTGLQASPLNRIDVDGKTQLVIFKKELNRAAALGKIRALPHYERAGPFQTAQDFRQLPLFRFADKNQLTGLQFRKVVNPPGQELAIIDCFFADDLIEGAAKRVVPEHAETDRSLVALKCVRGPSNEFREVKKERGFELVLDRGSVLRECRSGASQGQDSHDAKRDAKARSAQPAAYPSLVPYCRSESA